MLDSLYKHTVHSNLGGAEEGHYVTHLKDKDQFFTINDNKPVCKTREFEIELSQIYIFTNRKSTH